MCDSLNKINTPNFSMVYTRVFLSLPMMMMMMMSSLSSGLSSKSTSASTPSASHLLITTSPSQLQLNEAVCDASHLLVVATLDGHIHGINAASGSLLWRVQDEAWGPLVRVSSPVFTTPSQSKLRRRRRTSSASFAATATSLRQSALPYPSDALFPLVQDDNDADGEEDDSEDGSGEEEEESFVNLGTFVPEASGDGQLYQLSADNVLKVKCLKKRG